MPKENFGGALSHHNCSSSSEAFSRIVTAKFQHDGRKVIGLFIAPFIAPSLRFIFFLCFFFPSCNKFDGQQAPLN